MSGKSNSGGKVRKEDSGGEMDRLAKVFREHGSRTVRLLLGALFLWLFGVLVFIPLARSISWHTEMAVSLIVLLAFSGMLYRALPGAKALVDAFSSVPARKMAERRGIGIEDAGMLIRYLLYLASGALAYLMYLPFMLGFHGALAGIVLIVLLMLASILVVRILPVLGRSLLNRLG